MTIKEKFKEVKELINKDLYYDSITILLTINEDNLPINYLEFKYLMLGACHFQNEDYYQSIYFSEKALEINNKRESASLNKYLSHVYLKDYDSAFYEILKFLKDNPANLYKDTLKELLFDIESGFINDDDLIEAIKFLAKKNDILF